MQASLPLGLRAHNNRGLFADHYLDHPERLQALDEWRQATGIEEAFRKIAHLYNDKAVHFNKRINEPQTEHDFIRPVLNLLWREQRAGDCYQVQVTIPNVDVRRQPDYAFFRTAQDRRDAEARKGSLDYWRDVPALGDAKAWFASLDKLRSADENPTAQICNYLYRSRVRWGILTNGRIWRLYEREKSSAGGIYYEVDLEELLQRGDLEAFKYFYLFFRRAAFQPDHTGLSFIERVFQGSVDYAAEVGDRLKESVYDALRLLMNGFFEYPANQLNRDNPAIVKQVHENCLIVLYRLLFLFYAEDRNLLPRHDELYANYSLYHLQRAINQRLRTDGTYLPMSRGLWGELTNLFQLIDTGFEEGGIPAYNGGLFSPSKYPHIAHTPQPGIGRWEIGDRPLAHVLDMLAYQREHWDEAGTQDVDYNTLDVQHLGSIYEGLLELQPHIATEPMVETLVDGKLVFKPIREVPSPRSIWGQPPRPVNMGEVYLVTDRGERKATGSYYTPTYIVDYIVEHTVGPLAEEAAKAVAALRSEVSQEITKLERTRREWQKSSAVDAASHVEALSKLIEDQKRRLLEPYLTLKILDPAMGSGDFLVGAADFLSLAMATDPDLLPLSEMGDEDSQAFYKRLVVERCLYGIDLNPLAVELAKLSLWLHTVSRDKALSFLDHHLRCGNSLIGAKLEDDLMKEPPQFNARGRRTNANSQQLVLGFTEALTATHLHYFLDTFRKIMETPSGDAAMERQKDELYRTMDAVRDMFRAVANCWLAPFFGRPITPQQYEQAVQALRRTDAERNMLAYEPWFMEAQAIAQQKRSFHWELEFPEVFFDPHGFKPKVEQGFDAVIGNPPYERTNVFVELSEYLGQRFETAYGAYDIYVLFMERSLEVLNNGGRLGYITSNKFLVADYEEKLRDKLHSKHTIEQIIDLTECPSTFPGALISTAISVTRKGYTEDSKTLIVVFEKDDLSLLTQISKDVPLVDVNGSHGFVASRRSQTELRDNLTGHFTIYLVGKVKDLMDNLYSQSDVLKQVADVRTGIMGFQYWHLEPIVGDYTSSNTKTLPILPPSLIDRYAILWNWETVDLYKKKFAAPVMALDSDLVDDNTWAFFKKPKVVVRGVARRLSACTDTKGLALLVAVHGVIPRLHSMDYIAALFNSCLFNWVHLQRYYSARIPEGSLRYPVSFFEVLPIRRIAFTTPPNDRALLLDNGKRLCERCLSESDSNCVLEFVNHQLTQTPERADVVHDLLALLAEQMIDMNQEKQAEVKGFLTWLERTIGAEVDDLNNKTKVKVYHEHDFETLLAVLKQNRRKLTVNSETRIVQDAIEREYNASIEKLSPLKAKIVATDRLIDLIVYRCMA